MPPPPTHISISSPTTRPSSVTQSTSGDILPLFPPEEFLEWLRVHEHLSPREADLVRMTAGLADHTVIALALHLKVSSVRRMQALLLAKLGLRDGHRGLLRWIVERYSVWHSIA